MIIHDYFHFGNSRQYLKYQIIIQKFCIIIHILYNNAKSFTRQHPTVIRDKTKYTKRLSNFKELPSP